MYCPKCDMDFVEGVTVCSDCGSPLVDKQEWFARKAEEKAEEEKKKAEENARLEEEKRRLAEEQLQQMAAARETLENLSDEDREALIERAETVREMMHEPSVYVNEKDKYSNNQSAAIALIIVGIIFAVGAVLMWIGVLPDLGIIMKIALTGFAVICLVGAFISAKNARRYKGEIAAEEDLERDIINGFLEKYTREDIIAAVPAGELAEEELAIERMNYIQDRLSCENDIPDKTFSAMLAENIYDRLFEE